MRFTLLLTAVVWLTAAPAASPEGIFRDVAPRHWAYTAVDRLASTGVLTGYPDGTFRGSQPAGRGEAAEALRRFRAEYMNSGGYSWRAAPAGLGTGERHLEKASPFPDVPLRRAASQPIVYLAERGILTGYPGGTFCGYRTITRYELAIALLRARAEIQRMVQVSTVEAPALMPPLQFGVSLVASQRGHYIDEPQASVFVNAINQLTERGILQGFPDGTFRAARSLTRKEAALALYRLLMEFQRLIDEHAPAYSGPFRRLGMGATQARVTGVAAPNGETYRIARVGSPVGATADGKPLAP